jgi:hypothetical protein
MAMEKINPKIRCERRIAAVGYVQIFIAQKYIKFPKYEQERFFDYFRNGNNSQPNFRTRIPEFLHSAGASPERFWAHFQADIYLNAV